MIVKFLIDDAAWQVKRTPDGYWSRKGGRGQKWQPGLPPGISSGHVEEILAKSGRSKPTPQTPRSLDCSR